MLLNIFRLRPRKAELSLHEVEQQQQKKPIRTIHHSTWLERLGRINWSQLASPNAISSIIINDNHERLESLFYIYYYFHVHLASLQSELLWANKKAAVDRTKRIFRCCNWRLARFCYLMRKINFMCFVFVLDSSFRSLSPILSISPIATPYVLRINLIFVSDVNMLIFWCYSLRCLITCY